MLDRRPVTTVEAPQVLDQEPDTCHIARTESVYACGAPRDERMPLIRVEDGLRLVDCAECLVLWRAEGGW